MIFWVCLSLFVTSSVIPMPFVRHLPPLIHFLPCLSTFISIMFAVRHFPVFYCVYHLPFSPLFSSSCFCIMFNVHCTANVNLSAPCTSSAFHFTNYTSLLSPIHSILISAQAAICSAHILCSLFFCLNLGPFGPFGPLQDREG